MRPAISGGGGGGGGGCRLLTKKTKSQYPQHAVSRAVDCAIHKFGKPQTQTQIWKQMLISSWHWGIDVPSSKGIISEKWGITINLEKTKYVCIGEEGESLKLEGGGRRNTTKHRMYLLRYKNRPVGR